MQRLFSTYPNRSAGVALAILRVAVAATLVSPLVSGVRLCPGSAVEIMVTLSAIAAVLLFVGWFTSAAAASAVLLSALSLWICHTNSVSMLLIAILVSISLMGAGAYSVDAHLYGRRRLVVGRPSGQQE